MKIESITDYHANPAVSHSKLETYRKRPWFYYKKHILNALPKEEPSAAFRIGSAAHCMVLEKEEWSKRYAVKPEGIDRRTKDGKEKWANFEMEHLGKTIIDNDEARKVAEIFAAVHTHPLAMMLLAQGKPELTWRNETTLALQCRTDWFSADGCDLSEGRPYVADLKTVESLDSEDFGNFEKAVFRFGYHRQAGFYLPLITEIIGKPVYDFFFIAVEKVEPYGVAVYKLTDDAVAIGQEETISDLRNLMRSMRDNDWPNIPPQIRTLGVPAWYKGGTS